MKFIACLITFLTLQLSFLTPAFAARYLVVFKDSAQFSEAHSQWVLANTSKVQKMFSARSVQVNVQDSLLPVQSLVIESADDNLLTALAQNSDVIVEKEVFHKAPAPVEGHMLNPAWAFDMNYAVQDFTDEGIDQTPWGIKAVKAREAWKLSQRGLGARVLVLDTGVDKNHPALQGQIEDMKDFVGDHQAPYDVADKVGHGTHVSGTILGAEAANGFTGVAPKAKLLMGRVCSVDGCSNIAVASGIAWGIQKHVDVINMSLGGDFSTPGEKSAIDRAEKAGVIVVAASGNDGKPTVGFPAAYSTVIAVGAVNEKLVKADFSQWGPELDVVAPGVDVISSVPQGTGCDAKANFDLGSSPQAALATCFSGSAFLSQPLKKELVLSGLGQPADFAGKDLTGKFALISRGEITFAEKVTNALSANAAGVVVYNNTTGLIGGSITEDGTLLAIPVVMIEQSVGESLKQAIGEGKAVSLEVTTSATNFASYSGTSMACPHVAGVVALIKATKKSLTPVQVRNLLQDTSAILGPNTENQYGAGLVDAEKAVTKAAQ